MKNDMTVPCEDGLINLRAGAIIMKDGKVLMAGNSRQPYLYSVGGRIRFGETAAEAVTREVREETGVSMEVDRLGFVHENYFYGDSPARQGKLIYEVSFFFYMKVPEDFSPVCESFTEDDHQEFLRWIDPADPSVKYYPEFFRTELRHPEAGVKHFVTDERRPDRRKGVTSAKKILILGCPGSGKSRFALRLREKTGLPLLHLDNVWWKPDRKHISRDEFDRQLEELLAGDEWIIEGDYSRTWEVRIRACDTVVFLDYPEEVCLRGITERVGQARPDIPWTEKSLDPELVDLVRRYRTEKRPALLSLFEKYPDKNCIIFHSRQEASEWLERLS